MKGGKRKRMESDNEVESSKPEAIDKKQIVNKTKKTANVKKQNFNTKTGSQSRVKRKCTKNADMDYREVTDESARDNDSLEDYESDLGNDSNVSSMEEKPALKIKRSRPLGKNKKTEVSGFKSTQMEAMKLNQQNLKAWERDVPIRQPSEFIEVFKGKCKSKLITFHDTQIFKAQYSTDANETTDFVEATVLVDVPGLEYKRQMGELFKSDINNLLSLIKITNNLSCDMKQFIPQCLPKVSASQCKLPAAFAIQLKHYQQSTVAWMKQVEENVAAGTGWTLPYLAPLTSNGSRVMLDMKWLRLVPPPRSNDKTNTLTLQSKGGFLADEMGLGKTVTLLALLVSHGMPEPRIPLPTEVQWGNGLLLPTGATLLVAPSHLISQWKDEAAKCMPSLKVILITTKPQFDKVTYTDVMMADLVVVSVQFLLTNKCFTQLPRGSFAVQSLHALLDISRKNPLLEHGPNLCHFHWWRFVCDEAHEIIRYEVAKRHRERVMSPGLAAVNDISSVYRWYMTGTPFPNLNDSFRGALKFIGAMVDDESLVHEDRSLKVDHQLSCTNQVMIYKLVHSNLFVRNTKQSIGREYDVPEYVEELMLLTMSNVERAIYDRAHSDQERRQLCCHLQIAHRMQNIVGTAQRTLDEVKVAMIAHLKNEIKTFHLKIAGLQKDIQARKKCCANMKLDYTMTDSKRKVEIEREERVIRQHGDSIVAFKQSIRECEVSSQYLESLQPRVQQQINEPCSICLDEIKSLTLIPCGHFYCKACITQCVQQQGACPLCRKPVSANQLFEIVDEKAQDKVEKMSELQNLIQMFGTKMAYLIFYLRYLFREFPKSRVIIFSQWDDMLNKVGQTLSDNDIKNVFVKGNVHIRNKAINSFKKQEKTRVIMLSLEHAASGTNLIEASHVVLIDPVAESKEKAVAIENQAIGRAHRMGQDKQVKVVRLVMKGTIEYELYTRNYSDNVIDHVEMQFDTVENYGVQVLSTVKKVSALVADQHQHNDDIHVNNHDDGDDSESAGPSCYAAMNGAACSDDSEDYSDYGYD